MLSSVTCLHSLYLHGLSSHTCSNFLSAVLSSSSLPRIKCSLSCLNVYIRLLPALVLSTWSVHLPYLYQSPQLHYHPQVSYVFSVSCLVQTYISASSLHSFYLHGLSISFTCSNFVNSTFRLKFPAYSLFLVLSNLQYLAKNLKVQFRVCFLCLFVCIYKI